MTAIFHAISVEDLSVAMEESSLLFRVLRFASPILRRNRCREREGRRISHCHLGWKRARHRHGVLSCVPLSVIAQLTAEGGGSDRGGAGPVDVFTPRQFGECGPIH